MTRHSPFRNVLGLGLGLGIAASLGACGGGRDVAETAAEAGAPPSTTESQDQDVDSDDVQDDDDGNPGGPGDDGADGDGDGTGNGDGNGNPGGPGDVLVFEESGVEFGPFRDTGSGHLVCEVEGRCTLAEPERRSGEPDAETGVDDCLIAFFEYDPQARPNPDPQGPRDVFPEGATVTAVVDCPEPSVEESV